MKKLDAYIVKRLLATFFFLLFLFILIAVLIDITEKIDEMLEHKTQFVHIFNYYLDFIPHIMSLLAPLFVFISVIFFTSRLTNNSEIIAAVSGGVSFYRLLIPYIFSGIVIATLFFFGNHFLIPKANADILEFEQVHLKKNRTISESHNIHIQVDSTKIIYLKNYNPKMQKGYNVELETFNGNDVIYKVKAKEIIYIDSSNVWLGKTVTERENYEQKEVITSHKEKELDLSLLPDDFVIVKNQWETLNTPDLNKRLKREKLKGSTIVKNYQIAKHKRTTAPVAIIIFTVVGFALSSRKVRGGIGIHLFVGLLLCGVFIVLLQFSEIIAAQTQANPLIILWLPNLLFLLVAIYLVYKAQK